LTNSEATFLRALRRFGRKSLESILDEISIAITISIPRVVLVRVEISAVLGLASARMRDEIASNLNMFNAG
jgi:hypothetical protein